MKWGTHHRWDRIPKERMTEQIERRFVHGERAMVAQVFLRKGAIVETHTHESEQITYILDGALRFWLKVPIAAVCHKYGQAELLAPWFDLVDRFGRWHQMLNDVLDWSRDLDHQRHTYFLSEAIRRKERTESVAEWVIRDGLSWGRGELDQWADELAARARELGSPDLVGYVERRRRAAADHWEQLTPSLASLARLASAMRAAQREGGGP